MKIVDRWECSGPIFMPQCNEYSKEEGCTRKKFCTYKYDPTEYDQFGDKNDI